MTRIRTIAKRVLVQLMLMTLLGVMPACTVHAAIYDYPYPEAENKKGLALGEDMAEDALELNVRHATFNFPLSHFIAKSSECNSGASYSYEYKGKTYWFRKYHINIWDSILKKLKKNNMIVTGILLIDKRSDLKNLIYPAARKMKAGYYTWNMDGGENQRQIEAAISYLAKRYSGGKHGRVVGWIVGNEINSADEWNAAGKISFSEYMDLYARMFEVSSKIIHEVYSNARMYIPLDHFWNTSYSKKDYKGKECLDHFAKRMKRDGYSWNLAYHAYNGNMRQPSITAKQKPETTDQLSTPIITMKNLHVLTDYIRTQYGEKTRIILSEHGYSSVWKGKNVFTAQSESIALSYYLAMADPMVDSFVYYSHVDQNELTKVGMSYGLWKVSGNEKATNKKPSWSVFKYMDTDQSSEILDRAKETTEEMTGKKVSPTRTIESGKQDACGKYKLKKALKKGWKGCGAVRAVRQKNGSYHLHKDLSRNKNVYWGLQQSFSRLNASSRPHLCLTVRKGKLTSGRTQLLVRVFSSSKHVFEAYGTIPSNKTRRIRIDLSDWQYNNRITRIQLLVERESGNWKRGAGVILENIGFQ